MFNKCDHDIKFANDRFYGVLYGYIFGICKKCHKKIRFTKEEYDEYMKEKNGGDND